MSGRSTSGKSAGTGTGTSLRGGAGPSQLGTGSDSGQSDNDDDEDVVLAEPTAAEAGRAVEPAQVRYQRLAERRKSTGQTRPPPATGNGSFNSSFSTVTSGTPISTTSRQASTAYSNSANRPKFNGQNTTVNIATAFASAARVPLRPPVGAAQPRPNGGPRRSESFSLPDTSLRKAPKSDRSANGAEMADELASSGGSATSGGKETHTAASGPAAGEGSTKKRKVSARSRREICEPVCRN